MIKDNDWSPLFVGNQFTQLMRIKNSRDNDDVERVEQEEVNSTVMMMMMVVEKKKMEMMMMMMVVVVVMMATTMTMMMMIKRVKMFNIRMQITWTMTRITCPLQLLIAKNNSVFPKF